MTIASLPMYDLEPLREATDAWWRAIAVALRGHGFEGVPDALDRSETVDRYDHWSSPDLLLSQTCGYPLIHDFADRLRVVAVPLYDAPQCRGADSCSVVIVKEDSSVRSLEDLRGGRAAVNGFDSQSGCNAFRVAVAPLARDGRFFDEVIETGRHEFSMRMVAEGAADVCAVDCVTHALLSDTMAEAVAGTCVLTVTPHAPNLPYVTHIGRSEEEVRAMQIALLEAAEDPRTVAVRARLRLVGFTLLPQKVYERIESLERQAADMGYPELA